MAHCTWTGLRRIVVDRPPAGRTDAPAQVVVGVFLLGTSARGDRIRMLLLRPGTLARSVAQALLVPLLIVVLAGGPLVLLERDAIRAAARGVVTSPIAPNTAASVTDSDRGDLAMLPANTSKIVNADHLNVRQAPRLDAPVVTVLRRGSVVYLLNDVASDGDRVWTRVAQEEIHGWVSAEHLR